MDSFSSFVTMPQGIPVSVSAVVASIFIAVVYAVVTKDRPYAGFPVIALDEKGLNPLWSWIIDGRNVIKKGLKQTSGPFQVITGTGPKIILPNRYADEIKNHPALNFPKAFSKDLFAHYPGFEGNTQGLVDDTLMQETVRVKLTQSLGLVTDDLVEETSDAVHDIFGEDKEWHNTVIKEDALNLVARLSSRIFLGKPLCRNQDWLRVSKDYTVDLFIAARELRKTPSFLRPIMHWFLPSCRRLRQEVRDANRVIRPEVERRMAKTQAALAAGQKSPKTADSIGWLYEVARGRPVDYVSAQLSLSMAAIHTTSETTAKVMLDICEHPELIPLLRQEIVEVLGQDGWAKTSLYKLKLMDSVLKESQRSCPSATMSMNRFAEKRIELSDGTVIPKGSRISVSADPFSDPKVYKDPETFDPFRFKQMREQPGMESSSQFVSVTPQHMFFGYGQHACPGRFFASNEIKIALCHLLLRYDWGLLPGQSRPANVQFEAASVTNPRAQVQIRRRQAEIEI